jgi:hypothetical protein
LAGRIDWGNLGTASTCFVRADFTPATSIERRIKALSVSTAKGIFMHLARHFEVELAESLHTSFPLDCKRMTSITLSFWV